jgi:predicted amidohydrolase YtcJ
MSPLPRASLILLDACLHLADAARARHQAIAITAGRIQAIDDADELTPLIGPETQVASVEGRCVLPAFTDSHIHLELYARSLDQVDCETGTMEECIERLRLRAVTTPHRTWILGHGWNDNAWGHPPAPEALNRAIPNHPVYATGKSLHAAWANACALRLAHISADTQDPDGGALLRDVAGAPTGVLLESATHLVARHIPPPGPDELDQILHRAQQALWRLGIAAVHDFDGPRLLRAVQRLRSRGQLGLRVLKSIPRDELPTAIQLGVSSGLGDEWIRLGHVKLFADGALGSRTAAMLSPYLGEPENTGSLLLDEEAILEIGRQAASAGLPLAVHAIGDRATHAIIRAIRVLQTDSRVPPPTLPHRIEHLQLLHPDDIRQLRGLDCIASMQPIHATSDMLMADRYWGERARYAYAWKTALGTGVTLAFGSDAPVEIPDPLAGIAAAVTRRRPDGSPGASGWFPEERLTLREALDAYTIGPALAAGSHHEQGKIRPGFLADLIIADADPFSLPPDQLAGLRILGTMVGGAWRHRNF